MPLIWKEHTTSESCTFLAQVQEHNNSAISSAIACSIDKAVSQLNDNIDDNSRYLVFEWDAKNSILSIVVTDEKKENDAPIVVKCCFTALAEKTKKLTNTSLSEWEIKVKQNTENIKDIIRDYLTTCHSFFSYSLVAVFHSEGRSNSVLL